jgi:predicted thioesterase
MRVQFDHLNPTMVGAPVTAEATLEKIAGRRLTFTVSATDPRGLIGAGKVTRVIVDAERFLDKAR